MLMRGDAVGSARRDAWYGDPPDERRVPYGAIRLECPVHGPFVLTEEEQAALDAYDQDSLREVACCPTCEKPPADYRYTTGGNVEALEVAAAVMLWAAVDDDAHFAEFIQDASVNLLQSMMFEFNDEADSLRFFYLLRRYVLRAPDPATSGALKGREASGALPRTSRPDAT